MNKSILIFFLFSLYFNSFNRKYIKLTKMDITLFVMKLFIYEFKLEENKIIINLKVRSFAQSLRKDVKLLVPWLLAYKQLAFFIGQVK